MTFFDTVATTFLGTLVFGTLAVIYEKILTPKKVRVKIKKK